ncbi:hypothetical protein F4678DRAFT_455379 [Xylaria arbuscula]|nr:hypothetical protein F4678DRAFT_455379 [Xylaria arbuscula]
MSDSQQTETVTNAPNAVGQPSAATADGKSAEHRPAQPQDGPAPPAYQPPITTPPAITQQPAITPASNDNATTQGAATKESQQRQLVTPLHALTEAPAWIDCPFCKQMTKTRSTREGDSQQAITSFLCCLVCICLVCLPHLAGWCENTHIYCSNCGKEVAMIPHDGMIQVTPVGPETGLTPSRYAR